MGLKPAEIADSLPQELIAMWNGYIWRRDEYRRPFAVQSFINTMLLGAKDVTLEMMLSDFGITPAPAPTPNKDGT